MLPYRGAHGKDNMAYDSRLKEEEIKNKVAADLFPDYDCTRILGNVDFCVQPKVEGPTLWETESLLWAEAKAGVRKDLAPLFAQLVLTIGRARTHEKHSPPPFLGAFDCEKIAFLPYHAVIDLFSISDFDWTVTPSDPSTREFGILLERVRPLLASDAFVFRFDEGKELATFIRKNFVVGLEDASRLPVTRNNFVFVYNRWREAVKPSIAVNWDGAKKRGIIDADFFLADLLSKNGATLVEKLFIVLRGNHYELDRAPDEEMGLLVSKRAEFNDGQAAHTVFWNRYKRPPKMEYWHWIAERRDLLVPQDVRERKGSYFTPQIWVEKAQQTLAAVLGENWTDEYDVWDCAAGTGNLLVGLPDKYKIWASTLDQADVDVMHERIKNGANLLDSHVFRFDFLNDSFENLPDGLKSIVHDSERRKKLVVFINPPYAEATTAPTKEGAGMKPGVAKDTAANKQFKPKIGAAANELFALFLMRISCEIRGCHIGQFSTLKHIRAPNFKHFRECFSGKLEKAFLVPANTFDNVKGEFPIGFHVWKTDAGKPTFETNAEVFDSSGKYCGKKEIAPVPVLISKWTAQFQKTSGRCIGYERMQGSDFQNNQFTNVVNEPSEAHASFLPITVENLIPACIHFAVRLSVEDNWLVHNDLFSFPEDSWRSDAEFQLDCLVFTLFHGKNRISCKAGTNHWIPFAEDEVGAKDAFKSHFMSDFLKRVLAGRDAPAAHPKGGRREEPSLPSQSLLFPETAGSLLAAEAPATWDATGGASRPGKPPRLGGDASPHTSFSSEAQAVFDAGRELWRYYHAQPGALPDASFYDIRAHFQGFKPNGHMNADSSDPDYTTHVSSLRSAERALAAKLAPKVREHGFLR